MPQRIKLRPRIDPEDPPPPPPLVDATVRISRAVASGTSQSKLGVHLIQDTLDGNTTAQNNARAVLADVAGSACFHTVRFFGANALWTSAEESYASINWGTFDKRVNDCLTAGVQPIVVLGQAPAHMSSNGGANSADHRVLLAHHARFAVLCSYIVRRMVEEHSLSGAWYCMWNELKGYWNVNTNAWNIAEMVQLYNTCLAAMLVEDPTLKMGGPYAPIRPNGNKTNAAASDIQGIWGAIRQVEVDAMEYFVDNADQIDFLCYSGKPTARDGVVPEGGYTLFERMRLYADVNTWLRTLPGMSSIPISLIEWYAGDPHPEPEVLPELRSRYSAALYWHIRGGSTTTHSWKPEALGTDPNLGSYKTESGGYVWDETNKSGGGTIMPYGSMMKIWTDAFPPTTSFYIGTVDRPRVLALANATHTVLCNGEPNELTVLVTSGSTDLVTVLEPFETKQVAV